MKCEDCLYYVKEIGICGHPFLDEDLNNDCEWHEPIKSEKDYMGEMRTYRELVYRTCNETDFNDPEDATMTCQWLAMELLQMNECCLFLEHKLKEVLTAKEYDDFAQEAAKKLFMDKVEMSPNEEYKQFVKDHINEIIGGSL